MCSFCTWEPCIYLLLIGKWSSKKEPDILVFFWLSIRPGYMTMSMTHDNGYKIFYTDISIWSIHNQALSKSYILGLTGRKEEFPALKKKTAKINFQTIQYFNHKKYDSKQHILRRDTNSKQGKYSMGILFMVLGYRNSLLPLIHRPGNLASNCFYEKEHLMVSWGLLTFYSSPNQKHTKNPGIQSCMKR